MSSAGHAAPASARWYAVEVDVTRRETVHVEAYGADQARRRARRSDRVPVVAKMLPRCSSCGAVRGSYTCAESDRISFGCTNYVEHLDDSLPLPEGT